MFMSNAGQASRFVAALLILTLFMGLFGQVTNTIIATAEPQTPLEDHFDGSELNTSNWLIAYKNWGGKDSATGLDYNGGVVPQNVEVSEGTLKLKANGNLYDGPIKGINKNGTLRDDGKRTGAAIATREYFASGSYEVRAKIAPELGVCSAIWTFEYEEYYPGDAKYQNKPVGGEDYYAVNHEIDIEFPGRPGAELNNIGFDYALMNTWVGENDDEYTPSYVNLGSAQNDGQWHTYRFDWHTGSETEAKRVDFYVDGVLVNTNYTHIPVNAGRLWLGAWFPRNWAGTPNFDTTVFEIDWVKITPYNQIGDVYSQESFPNDGWYTPENSEPSIDVPGNLTATVVSKFQITISWDAVEGANGYDLEIDGSVIENVTSPYAHVDLIPGKTYTYRVRAKNGDSISNWSSQVRAATESEGKVNLVKNGDFSNGLTHWGVVASAIEENARAKLTADAITTARLEQVVTGLLPNTTYTVSGKLVSDTGIYGYIGVQDYGGLIEKGGTGSKSLSFTFTTGESNTSARLYLQVWKQQSGSVYFDDIAITGATAIPQMPEAPSNLAATPIGQEAINVSWSPVQGATGYDLLVNGVTITESVTSPYTHADLTAGTTYTYCVRAKNDMGSSEWSSMVSATTYSEPQNASLVKNGDFSSGTEYWTLTGSASLENGAIVLNSGADTDTIEQTVSVLPQTTYRLYADIVSNGVNVDVGVRDYYGRWTEISVQNEPLIFTTGDGITTITIYFQVLRYSEGSSRVDNIVLSQL